MRSFASICLIAIVIFWGASAMASGRLNFHLVNQTGQSIVEAKICPTYFPQYLSGNLLTTPLNPNSTIYIGPDYYGEQQYWTLALKWDDGREQAFPKLRLTRYNTYTVYPTADGIKIRQSVEAPAAE